MWGEPELPVAWEFLFILCMQVWRLMISLGYQPLQSMIGTKDLNLTAKLVVAVRLPSVSLCMNISCGCESPCAVQDQELEIEVCGHMRVCRQR